MDRSDFIKLVGAGTLAALFGLPEASEGASRELNAWPEGSELPESVCVYAASASGTMFYPGRTIEIGFKQAIQPFRYEMPVLANAIRHMKPAFSPLIEWKGRDGKIYKNMTQIFRTPYGITNVERAKLAELRIGQLREHLLDVQESVRFGHFTVREDRARMMGGVREYAHGESRLRVLRDLVLRTHTGPYDAAAYYEEWVSEVSLEVS
jgi:hypothetical protein